MMQNGHAADRSREAKETTVWDTSKQLSIELPLPGPVGRQGILQMPTDADQRTMLRVRVELASNEGEPVRETSFVVEWSGSNTLDFRVDSFTEALSSDFRPGRPALRLTALDRTLGDAVLTFGPPVLLDAVAPIPINDHEVLLYDLKGQRFWSTDEWTVESNIEESTEYGLASQWLYGEMWFIERPGRRERLVCSFPCDVDLNAFQAVIISTSIDRRASLSVDAVIDGSRSRILADHPGLGDGEEPRMPVSGRRLTELSLVIESAASGGREEQGVKVSTLVRWILLERTGADPADANEVRPIPAIADRHTDDEDSVLPVGILFGKEDLGEIRRRRSHGWTERLYRQIRTEAETRLSLSPEQSVGKYLPIDYGNSQGGGRLSAHMDQMRRFHSAMIYGGLVYLVEGDERFGNIARRAALSAARCDEWAAGFISRIPVGLPGYRAPFVSAHSACAVALAYDFCYPLFSEEERREIEHALFTKALPWIDLYMRMNGEGYLLTSNQGAVYAKGLIFACLVLRHSHPEVGPILERTITWFLRFLTTCYERDGSNVEGPSYWEYTTHESVAALLALSRSQGRSVDDLVPVNLRISLDYLLRMRSTADDGIRFLPVGDAPHRETHHFGPILLFYARFFSHAPAMDVWKEQFMERKLPPGSECFGRQQGAYSEDALLSYILYRDSDAKTAEYPEFEYLDGIGRTFFRATAGAGPLLCILEAGAYHGGHAHADKGQFIIEAYHEVLAADPGVVNYADPANKARYSLTRSHNTITVDGQDQDFPDPEHAAVTLSHWNTQSAGYACVDLSGSYKTLGTFMRHLLFVRPDYFVLVDEVTGPEGVIDWNFHSRARMVTPPEQDGTIEFRGASAGMTMCISAGRKFSLRTSRIEAPDSPTVDGLAAHFEGLPQDTWIAAVMAPYVVSEVKPHIECAMEEGGALFQVTGSWGTDTVRIRPPSTGNGDVLIRVDGERRPAISVEVLGRGRGAETE